MTRVINVRKTRQNEKKESKWQEMSARLASCEVIYRMDQGQLDGAGDSLIELGDKIISGHWLP